MLCYIMLFLPKPALELLLFPLFFSLSLHVGYEREREKEFLNARALLSFAGPV